MIKVCGPEPGRQKETLGGSVAFSWHQATAANAPPTKAMGMLSGCKRAATIRIDSRGLGMGEALADFVFGQPAFACAADAKCIDQGQHFIKLGIEAGRLRRGGIERFDRLAPDLSIGRSPHGGEFVAMNVLGQGGSSVGGGHASRDGTKSGGKGVAHAMEKIIFQRATIRLSGVRIDQIAVYTTPNSSVNLRGTNPMTPSPSLMRR